MLTKSAIFAVCFALSGCMMTYRPVQVGPNRYQTSAVAAPARGGIAGAQQAAAKAAGKQCLDLGKTVNVVNVETGREFPAAGSVVMTFECN